MHDITRMNGRAEKKTGFVFDRENVFGRFLQLIEREHLFKRISEVGVTFLYFLFS